ncbi:unnamed protein product [Owenia fusiformis]|uniref:E3 ubiquitin-protein ligase RNF25 n=1 Tax=Owenia fusiformis TaxID=6347 RepID=A0A8J1UYS0_OWEFU|nr:unnamed protein product [Owenia fusiformis]
MATSGYTENNFSSSFSIDESIVNEVEVLEEIYLDDIKIEKADTENGLPCTINVILHPATGDDISAKYVCLTLCISLSESYPHIAPNITVKNPRGLGDDDLIQISTSLSSLANERLGEPMLYELIELAKECLTAENLPKCHCAICLEDFSEGDSFIKTPCYHYFHKSCLARYIQHSLAEIETSKKEQEKACSHLTTEEKYVVCAVCREPFPDDIISSLQHETNPSSEEFVYQPSEDIRKLQEKMAALKTKQFEKGGIIDINEEKNRFLITEDTTIDVPKIEVNIHEPPQESSEPKNQHHHSNHRNKHKGQRGRHNRNPEHSKQSGVDKVKSNDTIDKHPRRTERLKREKEEKEKLEKEHRGTSGREKVNSSGRGTDKSGKEYESGFKSKGKSNKGDTSKEYKGKTTTQESSHKTTDQGTSPQKATEELKPHISKQAENKDAQNELENSGTPGIVFHHKKEDSDSKRNESSVNSSAMKPPDDKFKIPNDNGSQNQKNHVRPRHNYSARNHHNREDRHFYYEKFSNKSNNEKSFQSSNSEKSYKRPKSGELEKPHERPKSEKSNEKSKSGEKPREKPYERPRPSHKSYYNEDTKGRQKSRGKTYETSKSRSADDQQKPRVEITENDKSFEKLKAKDGSNLSSDGFLVKLEKGEPKNCDSQGTSVDNTDTDNNHHDKGTGVMRPPPGFVCTPRGRGRGHPPHRGQGHYRGKGQGSKYDKGQSHEKDHSHEKGQNYNKGQIHKTTKTQNNDKGHEKGEGHHKDMKTQRNNGEMSKNVDNS